MRNSLVAIFLAALAGNAAAAWTAIDKDESGTTHVDMDTIRRSGGNIKMWTMMSFTTPHRFSNGTTYLSSVTLYEFDCAEQRKRMLQGIAYSAPMREGEIVFTFSTPADWSYVTPGTVNELQFKIACQVGAPA